MAKKLSVSYLFKHSRSTNYFFRIRVPKRLRGVVSACELRYTLRTSELQEAKYRALGMAGFAEKLFSDLIKNGGERMVELSKESIDRLMREELQRLLEEAEKRRASATKPLSREELESQEDSLSYLESYMRENLILNDYRDISPYVDDLLRDHSIDGVVKGSEAYQRLCRELLKVSIRFHEIEQKRIVGDYSENGRVMPLMLKSVGQGSALECELTSGATLSTIIAEFSEEQRRSQVWREKTEGEVLSSLALLTEVLGDVPVAGINSSTMNQFKKALMKLPPNIRKNPEYREKTIQEILAMDISRTMSVTTINKYLDRASTLFKWAFRNGHMDRNPAEGLQLKDKKRDDEYRDAFSSEDLIKLFHSRGFLEDKHRHSYCFWLPIIALFTGMRLNEICQLHLNDFRNEDGIYVIDVIGDEKEKNLKNKTSRRLVPLHNFLVNELNLLGYVERLRKKGEARLFPELRKRRDGYGHTASKWFARYKERCGMVSGDARKDFHSFRHTVSNTLKQANVEPTQIAELLGHSVDLITVSRYGKRYSPKLLKEQVVDRLVYDVDLEHLKRSRFVVEG
jgi:integrase